MLLSLVTKWCGLPTHNSEWLLWCVTSHYLVANNTTDKPAGPTELDEDDDVPDLVENFDEASKDDWAFPV